MAEKTYVHANPGTCTVVARGEKLQRWCAVIAWVFPGMRGAAFDFIDAYGESGRDYTLAEGHGNWGLLVDGICHFGDLAPGSLEHIELKWSQISRLNAARDRP